mmetsp:Transcript_75342/g.207878  ORF Transcript_75342/g.207878 Transcript_75342/m.207878 type:complete len:370 (-) Transcript_75342:732-1841(-)
MACTLVRRRSIRGALSTQPPGSLAEAPCERAAEAANAPVASRRASNCSSALCLCAAGCAAAPAVLLPLVDVAILHPRHVPLWVHHQRHRQPGQHALLLGQLRHLAVRRARQLLLRLRERIDRLLVHVLLVEALHRLGEHVDRVGRLLLVAQRRPQLLVHDSLELIQLRQRRAHRALLAQAGHELVELEARHELAGAQRELDRAEPHEHGRARRLDKVGGARDAHRGLDGRVVVRAQEAQLVLLREETVELDAEHAARALDRPDHKERRALDLALREEGEFVRHAERRLHHLLEPGAHALELLGVRLRRLQVGLRQQLELLDVGAQPLRAVVLQLRHGRVALRRRRLQLLPQRRRLLRARLAHRLRALQL